jgi:hypothetical protein
MSSTFFFRGGGRVLHPVAHVIKDIRRTVPQTTLKRCLLYLYFTAATTFGPSKLDSFYMPMYSVSQKKMLVLQEVMVSWIYISTPPYDLMA